jgi:ABC-type antimicrobial peptide transport system permease subunit
VTIVSGFADISLLQLLLVALVALFASIIGGLAGYGTGAVTAQVLAFALLIGGMAVPGAFLAKAFVERMPVHIHTAILDVAVITGGLVMISAAVRQLI